MAVWLCNRRTNCCCWGLCCAHSSRRSSTPMAPLAPAHPAKPGESLPSEESQQCAEWFELDGTSKGHLVSPPAVSRDTFSSIRCSEPHPDWGLHLSYANNLQIFAEIFHPPLEWKQLNGTLSQFHEKTQTKRSLISSWLLPSEVTELMSLPQAPVFSFTQ